MRGLAEKALEIGQDLRDQAPSAGIVRGVGLGE
jgi:hypothetical protein